MSGRTGQLAVSLALLAFGVALAVGTWFLPNTTGYAQVGPRLFPGLIAGGTILFGVLLVTQALLTGFKNTPESSDPTIEGASVNWPAVAWLSAGGMAQMVLIAHLGFILTSTVVFFAAARAFGSRRPLRDLLLGFVLATVVYFLFTRALTLSLPWGSLMPGEF